MSLEKIDSYVDEKYQKYVIYKCSVCGCVGKIRAGHFKDGIGCGVCNGKRVVPGVNDIATTRPDLVQYFANKSDATKYTKCSGKYVNMVCPICGHIKNTRIADMYKRGFHCPICYDGISYPQKYVGALLRQLSIDFVTEKTFEWANKYRYDFYIPDKKAIIETNGEQHYTPKKGWQNYEAVVESDNTKKILAENSGSIDHYFSLDMSESTPQFCKGSVISSGLLEVIGVDEHSIDWEEIGVLAENNLAQLSLRLYKDGIWSTSEIGKRVGVTPGTVCLYLKRYSSIGACDYNPSDMVYKCQELASKARKKKVMCVTTGEIFESGRDAAKRYGLKYNTLYACLSRENKTCGKLPSGEKITWEYI